MLVWQIEAALERVQIQLLRQATVAQRLKMVRSMTSAAVAASRRACAAAHPDLSDGELDLLFVELNYGRELAERVRERLSR